MKIKNMSTREELGALTSNSTQHSESPRARATVLVSLTMRGRIPVYTITKLGARGLSVSLDEVEAANVVRGLGMFLDVVGGGENYGTER